MQGEGGKRPEVFRRIWPAPTVMTPGRVQPGKGMGRSIAPVAISSWSAFKELALPSIE